MSEIFRKELTKEEFPALEELESLLSERQLLTEAVAGTEGGFKFEVFANEHPPPHFRASYNGESASFSIEGCERIKNNIGLDRHDQKIRKWWGKNKKELIKRWNEMRPSDCPVGEIKCSCEGDKND